MADFYREHRVLSHDGKALALHVCFERLSDGQFAVAHAEFLREGDDLQRRLKEVGERTAELMLDPEQPFLWDFRPAIAEAIAAHEAAFEGFVEEVTSAQH